MTRPIAPRAYWWMPPPKARKIDAMPYTKYGGIGSAGAVGLNPEQLRKQKARIHLAPDPMRRKDAAEK